MSGRAWPKALACQWMNSPFPRDYVWHSINGKGQCHLVVGAQQDAKSVRPSASPSYSPLPSGSQLQQVSSTEGRLRGLACRPWHIKPVVIALTKLPRGEACPGPHLQVPLGLLEGAHDTEGAEQLPIGVRGDAGDDGVVGPLARAQAVGVLGVQQEVVPPVVQRETAPLRHDACGAALPLVYPSNAACGNILQSEPATLWHRATESHG